jgi:hypothetical protein
MWLDCGSLTLWKLHQIDTPQDRMPWGLYADELAYFTRTE